MYMELRENTPHGTKEYPYAQYHIHRGQNAIHFPVHWHDEVEIIYVTEGTLQIAISDQEYTGTAGSAFIVNSKELHYMSAPKVPISYYTLLFPLEFISFRTDDSLDTALMRPLRSGQRMFKNDISLYGPVLTSFLDELIQVNLNDYSGKQLRTRILLLEVLDILSTHGGLTEPSVSRKTEVQRELLQYIQQNYTADLSLQDLADHFHMSAKYISRYFKAHFDLSFSQYVIHLRITHAKRLLETTALPITEIALCSGFSSVSYFIRSFKKYCGVSPLQYRKKGPM